jgi:AcrR family transcriptional regulator
MTACTLRRVTTRSTPSRRRDPEVHRAAILQAAREALAEQGYARTTIRDVARRAGVTHGLVMRHFGSKEQLMLAAYPEPPGIAEATEGQLDTLPERLAHAFVSNMETGEHPMLAVIRSAATNERAAADLYDQMRGRSGEVLGRVLPAEALGVPADLVTALFIGVAFERYVMRTGSLAALEPAALERHLAGLVRHLLSAPAPG